MNRSWEVIVPGYTEVFTYYTNQLGTDYMKNLNINLSLSQSLCNHFTNISSFLSPAD